MTMTASIQDADSKSATSYKSTQSSRSGVLERARQYSRKMDQDGKRAKSLERSSVGGNGTGTGHEEDADASATNPSPRSQSTGRSGGNGNGNRLATRERALQSVHAAPSPQASAAAPSPAQHARRNVRTQPTTPASTTVTKESNTNLRATSQQPSPSNANEEDQEQDAGGEREHQGVVTPELLVDALSGHEDGLLAIAERLMEHYDGGYDVMGEAIIDAFADVQKLFQHVVEAAHMEGAAFEASRAQEEIQSLRQQVATQGNAIPDMEPPPTPLSPTGGPTRHDEFIDPDVKDCLSQAIRDGAPFIGQNKHQDCYVLYEAACQNASSLLPVDSDHRGRIQLSIARAESMSPDRACAILRYAMDDVLRGGLRAGKGGNVVMPDTSKRADVVLSKPKGHPTMNGAGGGGSSGVVQSGEEALASLVEEMKEILGAPVYDDTPLQTVAQRFWGALGDAQKTQLRNEERLEQHLGKLKGDFLLSRAEWEEKLTQTQEHSDEYKKLYFQLKEGGYLQDARKNMSRMKMDNNDGEDEFDNLPNHNSTNPFNRSFESGGRPRGVESVASLSSGLAQHARSLVGTFACNGMSERSGGVMRTELDEEERQDDMRRNQQFEKFKRGNKEGSSNSHNNHAQSQQREDEFDF